jgi:hypothetical protein
MPAAVTVVSTPTSPKSVLLNSAVIESEAGEAGHAWLSEKSPVGLVFQLGAAGSQAPTGAGPPGTFQ